MKIDGSRIVLAYAVLLLGVVLLLATIAAWLRFKVEIPVRDTVNLLPLVASGVANGWGSISLHEWLAPISGDTHRVVVTRFLMLLDYTLLGGGNYAIYLSAWLSILLLVFVYVRAAGMQLTQDRAGRCFVVGLALIYLCSPTQFLNLINPISASWYVAFACSAASVLVILTAGRSLGLGRMILACLLLAIAVFSNFAGVIACLVLPLVALHQRSRLSLVVLAFSAGLVFYFFNGSGSGQAPASASGAPAVVSGAGTKAIAKLTVQLGSPDQWLALLEKVATSVSRHLGAPLSLNYPVVASLAVLGSVLLIGYLWLSLLCKWCLGKEPGSRSIEFCLVMSTICLGISCAIPLARSVYTDPLSERYQTATIIYWLSFSCLVFFIAQGVKDRLALNRTLILLACIPLLPVLGTFKFGTPPSIHNLTNHASAAQILGQMGINYFEGKEEWWARKSAPYFTQYQEFLSAYGFEPLVAQASELNRAKVDQTRCAGFWLEVAASAWPGVQEVRIVPTGIVRNPFVARLDLRGNHGEAGRLYADVPRENDLRSIYLDQRIWRGYYRGEIAALSPVTLYVDPAVGGRYRCTLTEKRA